MGEARFTAEDLPDLESYRRELTGYCYRMLGSIHDADDAVQDTMVKALQHGDQMQAGASLRPWLYKIATNVCIDKLRASQRRAVPMELSEAFPPDADPGQVLPPETWVGPALDRELLPSQSDPADRAILRESLRLAFITILQRLPARQRAVLVLRDVLGWRAAEVASLLDTTEVAVHSSLQRAHATLAAANLRRDLAREPRSADQRHIVDRYMDAFERYDIETLVSLLHEEVGMSMPPLVMWFQGVRDVRAFHLGTGVHCKNSRLVPVEVNGSPGFAQYLAPDADGRREPWAIQVLEIDAGKIVHIHNFLDTALFPRFGLAAYLTD